MRDLIVPKLHKWPFLLGDALLLGLAGFLCLQGGRPMSLGEMLACVFCVAAGAGLGVLPFLSEYRASVRLAESEKLASTVAQIQKLEQVAGQISGATGQWQTVQESADKTAKIAKGIADGMAAEVKGFNDFLRQANDTERAALRLEADKARRVEGEWLQVLVRVLDHVFALNQAALRSGQTPLIEQLGGFQNACRDAARRVGLAPFAATPDEVFDALRHQVMEGDPKLAEGGIVDETIAAGYTFQGRLVRPALVRLRNAGTPVAPDEASNNTEGPVVEAAGVAQSQLPLER
jgi:molecular chaperone GrpE (heat shock protein)